MQIRLFFNIFTTSYIYSDQIKHRQQGRYDKQRLKQDIIPQLLKYGLIKTTPLKIRFTFFSVKPYPITNYTLLAQYILETMRYKTIIQDFTSECIDEMIIDVKPANLFKKEGCIIDIQKQIPQSESNL